MHSGYDVIVIVSLAYIHIQNSSLNQDRKSCWMVTVLFTLLRKRLHFFCHSLAVLERNGKNNNLHIYYLLISG